MSNERCNITVEYIINSCTRGQLVWLSQEEINSYTLGYNIFTLSTHLSPNWLPGVPNMWSENTYSMNYDLCMCTHVCIHVYLAVLTLLQTCMMTV